MSNKSIALLSAAALLVIILSGIVWSHNYSMMQGNTHVPAVQNGNGTVQNHSYAKDLIKPKEGQPIKKFTLTAQESSQEISNGLNMPVWTYNGTVPGEEIRVTQGDFVQVVLKNNLKVPVTIHWHGYPLLSAMDGIPGLTQDAVKPGETFTYEFSADVPGTYWYHSHQEGAKQVDKGLYGALIVEPEINEKIDRDYTLILDEWIDKPENDMESMQGMSSDTESGSMSGMSSSGTVANQSNGNTDLMDEEMMSTAYNIYTVNGKSGELISPLKVKRGDVVKLRFINAGYRSHGIHIPGQDFRVVSTDGQNIDGAGIIKDQILNIAPGERYDVEFTVTSDENFIIDAHDNNKYNAQLRIPVNVINGNGTLINEPASAQLVSFDLTVYGKPGKGKFALDQKYDVDYSVELGTRLDGNNLKYTINGKVFSELPPLHLKTGDLVKFTFENKSNVDHPMHLHGHFFQILSRNSKPVSGAPIFKDTLLVKPGEKYVVAFKADNPGRWVEHCHELHHAAAGMMQSIEYIDFIPNYTADPNNQFNKPE